MPTVIYSSGYNVTYDCNISLLALRVERSACDGALLDTVHPFCTMSEPELELIRVMLYKIKFYYLAVYWYAVTSLAF